MSVASLAIPANPPHRGAYQRGYAARLAGESLYSNPFYRDDDDVDPPPGWRASFASAWASGWFAADAAVPDPRREAA